MTKMIGQLNLQEKVLALIESDKFPRFCLLVGDKGSGKKTFAEWFIGQQLGVTTEICDISVESVRNVIAQAYTTVTPMLYVFLDADNMSLASKNALLKVTEEPPNNAYFLMTVTNVDNVLPTIQSRAFVLYMDAYTRSEIVRYYREAYTARGEYVDIIERYCQTPYDVDLLYSYNPEEFNKYIEMVYENIDKVSGANSFKIGARLDLGTDEKKYDLALFWKAFRECCMLNIHSNPLKSIRGIDITSKYLYDLRLAGCNKTMAFDSWLLDIRKEWMEYAENNKT